MSPTGKASAVRKGLRSAITTPAAAEIPQSLPDLAAETNANHGSHLPPSQRPKPPKPTRFTLDLDDARHRFLKAYAAEIEAKGAAEVMRALLDELQADPELAARVRARVWQTGA